MKFPSRHHGFSPGSGKTKSRTRALQKKKNPENEQKVLLTTISNQHNPQKCSPKYAELLFNAEQKNDEQKINQSTEDAKVSSSF